MCWTGSVLVDWECAGGSVLVGVCWWTGSVLVDWECAGGGDCEYAGVLWQTLSLLANTEPLIMHVFIHV